MEIVKATARNFARHFIVCGLLAVVVMLGMQSNSTVMAERPVADGSYADVMESFTCENTVDGEFPTAVVLQEVGGGVVVSVNPNHVSKALDEEFAGKNWERFDAIQFCK